MSKQTDELIEIVLNMPDECFVIRSISEELELLTKRKASAKMLKSHIEKLEHELEICKHASKTMCELYDKRNDEIVSLADSRDAWKADAERLAATFVISPFPNEWICRGGCHHWARFAEQIIHAPDCPITLHNKLEESEK